jgi:hypothetical protein
MPTFMPVRFCDWCGCQVNSNIQYTINNHNPLKYSFCFLAVFLLVTQKLGKSGYIKADNLAANKYVIGSSQSHFCMVGISTASSYIVPISGHYRD